MAINLQKNQKPYELKQGIGITGVTLSLNINQCQNLGMMYEKLSQKQDRTPEEEELGSFLSIFRNFQSPNSKDLWSNFENGIETEKLDF